MFSRIRKARPDQTRAQRRWSALALLVTAQFVVILDQAIVNVALPTIKTHLHFSTPNLQYVVTAYAITFGGLLLLGGRLSDRLGRLRLFMAGVALFTVASLLNGISTSSGELIAFRAVQGIGAALLTPAALSLLVTTFTEARERNLALGIWGASAGAGGAAGLLLGGALTTGLSWRWIFFINIPIGVAVALLRCRERVKMDKIEDSWTLLDKTRDSWTIAPRRRGGRLVSHQRGATRRLWRIRARRARALRRRRRSGLLVAKLRTGSFSRLSPASASAR